MSVERRPEALGNSGMPEGAALRRTIAKRQRSGQVWRVLLFVSTIVGLLVLGLLLYRVVDDAFGYVAITQKVDPATLAGVPLAALPNEALVELIRARVSPGVFNRLNREQPFTARSQANILELVYERVVERRIADSWTLTESLFDYAAIKVRVAERYPGATIVFRSWLNADFLTLPMASKPEFAGVRTALLGSLWMIAFTMLVAFPIGVCAAIYLEEYATDTWFNRIISTNIYNLAGVPSIIYGMLGLAIFVRGLERYTSGQFLGITDTNGRTIISASLTMALLVLPLIIINAQEAIRAVPRSLRMASYGLGATKWQTIWHHVLPLALPGILTGTILAMSRAIGETAPLIVVGASTFIAFDPAGPFSKFTTLPIQIYDWAARPEKQFRNIAAAAIIVLLLLLISLNTFAIILRNRFRRKI